MQVNKNVRSDGCYRVKISEILGSCLMAGTIVVRAASSRPPKTTGDPKVVDAVG